MLAAAIIFSALAAGVFAGPAPGSWQILQARQYESSNCDDVSPDVQEALDYERSNYVHGPTTSDPFYSLSGDGSDTLADPATAAPGTLLKLEAVSNISQYTIPPSTSVSRFVYQSQTLLNTTVPVSAFILWPLRPRTSTSDSKAPIVAYAQGGSGIAPACAPSNIRNLWQHYLAPFALAAQGYVVVATDYAGLGVSRTPGSDEPIIHPFLASPAHANDLVYSVQAAREAFPEELSRDFVVAGHSQGGGAAWAVAERQAVSPVEGYLGAVAVAPVTRIFDDMTGNLPGFVIRVAPGVQDLYRGQFEVGDVATAEGEEALGRVFGCGACQGATAALLGGSEGLIREDWRDAQALWDWQEAVVTGRKAISGPLFVAHGTADAALMFESTFSSVKLVRRTFAGSQITFETLVDSGHVDALTASQPLWMDWIADRFAGVPYQVGDETAEPVRPFSVLNWFIGLATAPYETP